jgi:hypothetical protein
MKLATKLLARSGIIVGVSAALLSASVAQAAVSGPSGLTGPEVAPPPARPAPEGPVEERVKQAIEEVNQKDQTALEELGELDSPEKVEQAERILKMMEQATREIRQRLHSRESDRFEELNDLAVTRLHHQAQAELKELGQLDTPEKREKAEEIRARVEERKAQLEERWNDRLEPLQQRRLERPLPEFDFRPLPQDRPPQHAPAYGLRLRLKQLSEEGIEAAIAQLKQEAQAALKRIGEQDTPGKVQRANKIRARMEERIRELQEKLAGAAQQQRFEAEIEQETLKLRQRAQSAIEELGELDTPEKQEMGRRIQANIEEQVKELRERMSRRARQVFDEQFEQRAEELRQQAQAALEELGELDTPEKQELARQIRARMEEQVKELRVQLAHRASGALDEQFEQELEELRQQAQAALRELGRLDTPEKIERARQIRARMEDGINHLKRQQAHHLRNGETFGDQVRANALERREQARELRAKTADALPEFQGQRDRREGQIRQVIRQRDETANVKARTEQKIEERTEKRAEERVEQARDRSGSNDNTNSEDDSNSRDGSGSDGRP